MPTLDVALTYVIYEQSGALTLSGCHAQYFSVALSSDGRFKFCPRMIYLMDLFIFSDPNHFIYVKYCLHLLMLAMDALTIQLVASFLQN